MSSFSFTWEVSDGYCGGARPQRVTISDHDIEDDMDEKELLALLEGIVQDDFENVAHPTWKDSEEQKFLEWAKAVIKNSTGEN